jgi:four helix bundle protein
MSIVIEESDETLFWLEIILEKQWITKSQIDIIWKEGNELTAIFVSSMKTIKERVNTQKKI